MPDQLQVQLLLVTAQAHRSLWHPPSGQPAQPHPRLMEAGLLLPSPPLYAPMRDTPWIEGSVNVWALSICGPLAVVLYLGLVSWELRVLEVGRSI